MRDPRRPTYRLPPGPTALWDWMERRVLNQREAARVLGVHYMSLNQMLRGKRKPGLTNALLIEKRAGIPAGLWARTRVSAPKRRKSVAAVTVNNESAYSHAD